MPNSVILEDQKSLIPPQSPPGKPRSTKNGKPLPPVNWGNRNGGGRPKGSLNKSTRELQSRSKVLMDKLTKEHNFDVIGELLGLYKKASRLQDKNDSWNKQFKILSKFMDYCFPKLKAMEIATDAGKKVVFNFQLNPGQESPLPALPQQ